MEMNLKVGDAVLVFQNGRVTHRKDEAIVTKIGRKYVYVSQYGREYPYDMKTGRSPDGSIFIRTPEQHADELKRAQINTDLRTQFGIAFGYMAPKYTTEQLEKLLAFMVELTA